MLPVSLVIWSVFWPHQLSPVAINWPDRMANSKNAMSSDLVRRIVGGVHSNPSKGIPLASSTPNASLPQISGTVPQVDDRAYAAKTHPRPGVRRGKADVGNQIQAYVAKAESDRRDMLALLSAGQRTEGKRRLQEAMLNVPDGLNPEFFALPLLDAEIENGDYVSAYKIAAGLIQAHRTDYEVLLRGSLASAMLGEVYPGQREFLIENIQGKDPGNEFARSMSLPGSNPATVAALSRILIASGMTSRYEYMKAIPLWQAVLQFDPGNPAVCRSLCWCYTMTFQYSLGVKAAEAGLARSGSGVLNVVLTQDLRACKKSLREVGDGHEAPSHVIRSSFGGGGLTGAIHP